MLVFIISTLVIGSPFLILLVMFIVEDRPLNGAKDYISFKQFKSFYEINHNRWELDTWTVGCHKDCYVYDDYIWFKFHLIDLLRYKIYKQIIIKNQKKYESSERYKEMIRLVKSDINDFKQRTQQEAEDQLKEIWKVS